MPTHMLNDPLGSGALYFTHYSEKNTMRTEQTVFWLNSAYQMYSETQQLWAHFVYCVCLQQNVLNLAVVYWVLW